MINASTAHVAVAPGDGLVARRDDAVAFISDSSAARDELDAFDRAIDGDAALDHLTSLALRDGAAPFVGVHWSSSIRVVVFGPVEVRSDRPDLTMITAGGSTSWIERTLPADQAVTLVTGGEASGITELELGRVPGGGFEIALAPASAPEITSSDELASTGDTGDTGDADSTGESGPPRTEPVDQPAVADWMAASGGDWMEDTLGLGAGRAGRPDPGPVESPVEPGDDTPADLPRSAHDEHRHEPGADRHQLPEIPDISDRASSDTDD